MQKLSQLKAAVLVKNGAPNIAFEIREMPDPSYGPDEVRINVQAFGLNYADVMARLGLYQDCPPLPTIVGYEVVGIIDEVGEAVKGLEKGQRVLGFTRFGAYATKAVTKSTGVVLLPDHIDNPTATALATQYSTAYYAAEEMVRLHKGDHVLIHAAAGGVGTALIQLAKHHQCIIYGTASAPKKLAYLKEQGVHYPINYKESDWVDVIQKIAPDGKVDVIFDSIGGDYVKQGMSLLHSGGRMVCYGASSMTSRKKNPLKTAWKALQFGLYHPVQFMMSSKALVGVNMLRIADFKPQILQRCLTEVVDLTNKGILKPTIGGIFPIDQLAEAHDQLERRKTIGKIVVIWV